MEFNTLYQNIIKLWPSEIDISDWQETDDGNYFEKLNHIHHKIEDKIDHQNDHWSNIGVWSFFQSIHSCATTLAKSGHSKIIIAEIDKEIINANILNNLQNDEWAKEKENYVSL